MCGFLASNVVEILVSSKINPAELMSKIFRGTYKECREKISSDIFDHSLELGMFDMTFGTVHSYFCSNFDFIVDKNVFIIKPKESPPISINQAEELSNKYEKCDCYNCQGDLWKNCYAEVSSELNTNSTVEIINYGPKECTMVTYSAMIILSDICD
jgi:hypothetical protein